MNDKKENGPAYLPLWMCFGMSIGTAIGAATDNLSLWMSLGVSIGLCLGVAMDSLAKKKKDGGESDG